MINITSEKFYNSYLNRINDKELYEKKVSEYEKLKRHFDGNFSDVKALLKNYQPSEPSWALKYKEENYRPITKKSIAKILSVIQKISHANDFTIIEGESNPKVAKGEDLFTYISSNFGKFGSIQNWFFNYHFENYFKDPNGCLIVIPKIYHELLEGEEIDEIKSSEYLTPLPYYYDSTKVKYFSSELVIIECKKNEWIVFDKQTLTKIQKVENNKFVNTEIWNHNLGYIPALLNGGYIKTFDDDHYFESFLSGVVPDFDQALILNADKNVAIKMHIYPESAIYGQHDCGHCNGTGILEQLIDNKIERHTCKHCNGTGTIQSSTFSDLIVRPLRANEEGLPSWAPKKYIDKDIKPVEFVKEEIKDLIKSGYEAVNMAHLSEIPLNTSGTSKMYDWEQTNLFLYNIADYVCQVIFKSIIKFVNDIRYNLILSEDELAKQLPFITTPTNYDIVGVSQLEEQISKAKQNGISSSILEAMELAYISKKFAGNPNEISYHTNIIELDPLRGCTQDDILSMQTAGVSKTTIIMHNLINQFVSKAFEEVSNFKDKKLLERYKIIEDYANQYIKENKIEIIPIMQ